jgi:CHASE3 domain sensor protein
MSFKLARNLGLLLLVIIIVIMGVMSSVSMSKIAQNISDLINKERTLLDKIQHIEQQFLDAKNIFLYYLSGKDYGVAEIAATMDEVIKGSMEIKELLEDHEKKTVDQFITAAKRFKMIVTLYIDEAEYDPTGSAAINLEKIANTTAAEATGALTKLSNDIILSSNSLGGSVLACLSPSNTLIRAFNCSISL